MDGSQGTSPPNDPLAAENRPKRQQPQVLHGFPKRQAQNERAGATRNHHPSAAAHKRNNTHRPRPEPPE